MNPPSRSRQRFLRIWPWAGLAAAIVYVTAGVWLPSSGYWPAAGAILSVASGSLATATILVSVGFDPREGARRALRLLGAALFLWTLAEGYRAMSWAVGGRGATIPSVAELLKVAGYLSLLVAAISYASSAAGKYGRLSELLDTAIMLTAGSALAWLVVIRPVSLALPTSEVLLFWASFAPTLDLVLLLMTLRLLFAAPSLAEARGFGVLGLALLSLMVSDLVRGYLALGGEIGLPTLVEAGWVLAACLTGLVVARVPAPVTDEGGEQPVARPLRQRMVSVLPVALTYAVVGFTLLNWRLVSVIDWAGVGAAVVLSLLLVARQGVIGGQSEMRQFAALVNASGDLAFVAQVDGLLRLTNPAVNRALRLEAPPNALEDFLASPKPSRAFLHTASKDGWSGEVELRREDGSLFPASLNLRPVWDERLSRALLVGTAADLTRIREREDDLRAALSQVAVARSDLEASNAGLEQRVNERTRELEDSVERLRRMNLELQELGRLKTEFVTLVSHELRAPLTNIRAGVELLLAAHPDLGQGVREQLDLVAAETERLGGFVEAILDLSALEAGRFPLHSAPTHLQAAVLRVVARLRTQPQGADVVVDLPPSLPPVWGDERAVDSVLFHLLDNALKYAPGGEVCVQAEQRAGQVFVTVTDHGPGIPPEERQRVFEMFHRLDARDAREVYGHGLGLHLARRLLEAMGGGIRAEQAPGGGTRMAFWIPIAPD
jgi:signal transduction histidine kinase